MTIDGTKMVVAETNKSVVGISLADGKTKWKTPFPLAGKGPGQYNASTPLIDGSTVIFSGIGRGVKAVQIEKKGAEYEVKELWANKDNSVQYNSPVLRDGHIFALANNDTLFCVDAKRPARPRGRPASPGAAATGNILVDAGPVLLAITPQSKLIVFEPSAKEYLGTRQLQGRGRAGLRVPGRQRGNRVYVKDQNSLTLWTVE